MAAYAKLLGARDSVVLLSPLVEVILGRGSNNIPPSDKRCSRESVKVKYCPHGDPNEGGNDTSSVDSAPTNPILLITQVGVNPGIVHHGTPQEAYMTKGQTYKLKDGQKFTVLMHEYEFTASLPSSAAATPPPAAAPAQPKATVSQVKKSVPDFDWMGEEDVQLPKKVAAVAPTSTAPSKPSKPVCKYGASCYRQNPDHFKEYAHPHLDKANNKNGASSSASPAAAAPSKTLDSDSSKKESAPPPIVSSSKMDVDGETVTEKAKPIETASTSSTSASTAPVSEVSSGKRPMPALDIMDDEEEYYAKAPPTKKKVPLLPAATPKAPTNVMDWMDDSPPEKPSQAPQPESKTVKSEPSSTAAPAASTSSSTAATPVSSQSSQPKPSTKPTETQQPSSQGKNGPSLLPNVLQHARPTISLSSSQSTISTSTSATLKACHITTKEELQALIKQNRAFLSPSRAPVTVLIPNLGRSLIPANGEADDPKQSLSVQESVDVCLEALETFLRALPPLNLVDNKNKYHEDQDFGEVGVPYRFVYWPESAASAASFRRRLPALLLALNDSYRQTLRDLGIKKPVEAPYDSVIKMLSPNAVLFDPSSSAFVSLLQESNPGGLIVVNDSNWRFKGVGPLNSFNVQVNTLAGAQLVKISKESHSVGLPTHAYPVTLSAPVKLASVTLQHIIQVVSPSLADEVKAEGGVRLSQSLLSAFAALVPLYS